MTRRGPLWRIPPDRGVDDELAGHMAELIKKYMADGLDETSARAKAAERFGDVSTVRDECSEIAHHIEDDMRKIEYAQELRQDVAYALRSFRRAPGFTLIAILTLAIGIGANTAIFSVVRSTLLRPLPYPNAEQLVQVWSDHRQRGREQPEWMTPPDFADWRDQNHTFSSMAAYQGWFPDLTSGGDPESLAGFLVSGDFFKTLGAAPALGRLLTTADDDPGVEPVVVLSHAFWERRFGGDSSVLRRVLTLDGLPYTVVGVLPKDFRTPMPVAADVFRATRRPANAGCGRGCVVLRVIGRLMPNATFAEAQSDLSDIASRIAKEYPASNDKVGAWLIPLHEQVTGTTKAALLALTGAVALVLLIGCVNLASLLLVRGAGRERELSVRAALGAGSGRIVRQLLTENAVLALAGGALGLLIGIGGSNTLGVLVPAGVRRVQEIHFDGGVLAFTAGITLLAGAIFGLLPALQTARGNFMGTLRNGGREMGPRGGTLRGRLVVPQLALAVVLLVGAGLLLRSFLLMERVDFGYRTEGVLFATVGLPQSRYPDAARIVGAMDGLLARIRANPSVRSAELVDEAPLTAGDQDITAIAVGEPAQGDHNNSIWYRAVTAGYMNEMHLHIVAGRTFTDADRAGGAMVGIVNEQAARRYWPGKDPIGRQLATSEAPDASKLTVVGVVNNARQDGPNQPYKSELFIPFSQLPSRGVTLVVEPSRDIAAATTAIRSALKATDAFVPAPHVVTIESLVGDTTELPKMYATLVGVFAAMAMLLAALGVYGVMAYTVSQRRREIGVRLALGAEPSAIRRAVLVQGGMLALLGVGIGLAAALLLGRALRALLFGVSAFDAPTFVIAPLLLGAMTLLASWIPAQRAMRVDPIIAIRDE